MVKLEEPEPGALLSRVGALLLQVLTLHCSSGARAGKAETERQRGGGGRGRWLGGEGGEENGARGGLWRRRMGRGEGPPGGTAVGSEGCCGNEGG